LLVRGTCQDFDRDGRAMPRGAPDGSEAAAANDFLEGEFGEEDLFVEGVVRGGGFVLDVFSFVFDKVRFAGGGGVFGGGGVVIGGGGVFGGRGGVEARSEGQ